MGVSLGKLWRASKARLQPLSQRYDQALLQFEARTLLEEACGVCWQDIILTPDQLISRDKAEVLEGFIDQRLAGVPLYRILGRKEFYGRSFTITPDTLEPRADTEALIRLVAPLLQSGFGEPVSGLDVGCGSGIIAITLLALYPQLRMRALDISEAALKVTAMNARVHQVENRLSLLQSNLFEKIDDKVQFIISNPPYITAQDMATLPDDVKNFDPPLALYGGDDGLFFYRELAEKAHNYLTPSGHVAVEIGYDQSSTVPKLFEDAGYSLVASERDLNKIVRALLFRLD